MQVIEGRETEMERKLDSAMESGTNGQLRWITESGMGFAHGVSYIGQWKVDNRRRAINDRQ